MDWNDYFSRLEGAKPILAAYSLKLEEAFNNYLQYPEMNRLHQLEQLFRTTEGVSLCNTRVAMQKAFNTLEIVELEAKNNYLSFLFEVSTMEMAADRYQKLIMMLRRVEMTTEENDKMEAIGWLLQNRISPIAIRFVLQKEIFGNALQIREYLKEVYQIAGEQRVADEL
ncbi:MAG: hypothetical protein PUE95_04440 [Lachnospiraceae bacterium]|nr:hypothetical protein [Lachnospiraceae bacterium]